jgi:hypothetical protein
MKWVNEAETRADRSSDDRERKIADWRATLEPGGPEKIPCSRAKTGNLASSQTGLTTVELSTRNRSEDSRSASFPFGPSRF